MSTLGTLKLTAAKRRVGGQLVRTVVFADSATHARLLVQYQLGMDSVIKGTIRMRLSCVDI